ncbi:hypothetical protein QUF80_22265 [Desulfococcaceae bacterium HSG8]|nr:hypothetical protein [Desulfococcaceae bacterium HSG8]
MSESSAHRHKKAVERRNQHPESLMWETEEGQRWLIILVCATLYIFGICCGIGMGTISEFFKRIRPDKHLGVSPASLQRMVSDIEKAITGRLMRKIIPVTSCLKSPLKTAHMKPGRKKRSSS